MSNNSIENKITLVSAQNKAAKADLEYISKFKNKGNRFFSWSISRGIFWFRIFGYGLHFKNLNNCGWLSFSNRNRLGGFYFSHYVIKTLKP